MGQLRCYSIQREPALIEFTNHENSLVVTVVIQLCTGAWVNPAMAESEIECSLYPPDLPPIGMSTVMS